MGQKRGIASSVLPDERRGGVGEGGEALDEVFREDVETGWESPVAEVPDDLCSAGDAGFEHGKKARPIVLAGMLLDEVPAKAVAHSVDTD